MDYTLNDADRNEAALKNDIARLTALKQAGVTDSPHKGWCDQPAWVWQRFIDLCESTGIRRPSIYSTS